MLALTRERLDLVGGRVRVVEQYTQLKDGTNVLGPPKSAAGVRTIAIPAVLIPELERQLDTLADPGKDGLVFPGRDGQPLRRSSWYTAWSRAMRQVGIEGMRPHDLRHTGNTLAAMTGASTKELMARFGQSTPRAALIYQHATENRDREIADALSDLVKSKLTTSVQSPSASG
jgi:integrase